MSYRDFEPPTPGQITTIARLSMALRLPEPSVRTQAEAGRMVRELLAEMEYRRKVGKRRHD